MESEIINKLNIFSKNNKNFVCELEKNGFQKVSPFVFLNIFSNTEFDYSLFIYINILKKKIEINDEGQESPFITINYSKNTIECITVKILEILL
jgi:hypothetical protein